MAARKLLVDIHTHVYLPRYASVLRSRSSVPFIRTSTSSQEERLLVLDHEPNGGRPVGPQYWDREGACHSRVVLYLLTRISYRKTEIHGQTWDRHIRGQVCYLPTWWLEFQGS